MEGSEPIGFSGHIRKWSIHVAFVHIRIRLEAAVKLDYSIEVNSRDASLHLYVNVLVLYSCLLACVRSTAAFSCSRA